MQHKPITEERLRQKEERSNLARGRFTGSDAVGGAAMVSIMEHSAKESARDVPDLVAEVRRLREVLSEVVNNEIALNNGYFCGKCGEKHNIALDGLLPKEEPHA